MAKTHIYRHNFYKMKTWIIWKKHKDHETDWLSRILLRIINDSFIYLAKFTIHLFFFEHISELNFWTVGHEHWPKYFLLKAVYWGQHKTKWYSDSKTLWLHILHSLFSLTTLWYLPISISNLCELKRRLVRDFLSLSLYKISKYGSNENSVLNLQ